jgi:hypothetical protein
MTCASVSLAQSITVVEPRTGNFEYIGQGNAGDSAIVYLTFSGLQIGGRNETAGFDITYADAAGNPVGGIVNIADLVADDQFGLCQQVPGGGDGDNNIESGETWSVNIAGALGGAIPPARRPRRSRTPTARAPAAPTRSTAACRSSQRAPLRPQRCTRAPGQTLGCS